jgi:hypothetical protein
VNTNAVIDVAMLRGVAQRSMQFAVLCGFFTGPWPFTCEY